MFRNVEVRRACACLLVPSECVCTTHGICRANGRLKHDRTEAAAPSSSQLCRSRLRHKWVVFRRGMHVTHSYRHNFQVHVTSVRCDERIGDDLKVENWETRHSCLCSCGFSCLVQASISSVVKDSDSRLDLGKLEIDDHGAIQLPQNS